MTSGFTKKLSFSMLLLKVLYVEHLENIQRLFNKSAMKHKDLKNGKENKKEDRLQDKMFIQVFVTIEFEVEKTLPNVYN
jgi:hypothetical protein